MVRTRRYIYSPRDVQETPKISSKEKRISLLNRSRNLIIEQDDIAEQPKKKFKKNNLNNSNEILPKTPNTSIKLNKTIKKRSGKKKIVTRKSIFNALNTKSINSLKALRESLNRSLKRMDKKFKRVNKRKQTIESSSTKIINKKRQHSFESNSEKVIKKKKRKIEPFITSTPLNKEKQMSIITSTPLNKEKKMSIITSTPLTKEMSKRVKHKKKNKKHNQTVQKEQSSIYNPEYHLNSTLKLAETKDTNVNKNIECMDIENKNKNQNNDIIDITTPRTEKLPLFTLSETPINQHLSINLTPNIYRQLKMPDIIEIDDDEEATSDVDYVNLLSPSVIDEDINKDDDSVIIIDDNSIQSAATQMTPRPLLHDVIEIGTQITPYRKNTVSTNTSKMALRNVFGTKSVQTVTTNKNNNVVTQSTSTSIVQISKNVTSNVQEKSIQQRITPQNFSFQQNNGVISDFVQRIKQLEDQFIKHALLPSENPENNTELVMSSEVGNNIYNPNRVIKKGLRLIVIDGSNVAIGHSNGKFFSCEGLKICIDYFLNRGHEVKAFVPQYRRQHNQSSNPKLLEFLAKCNLVIFTPSRQVNGRMIVPYDDRYIVQCAAERGGVIVSNDNYRDLLGENPAWRETISKRLLMWTWCGDMIMFPIDPCGRGGPLLDQFLRF